MTLTALEGRYAAFHLLREFFTGFEAWDAARSAAGMEKSLSAEEYGWLFHGTRAGWYVPLWASCAKSRSKLLLDETTLAVIERYLDGGYRYIGIDGNPADYIGEQLRYLEYLAVAAIKGDSAAEREAESFINSYTLDTAKAMSTAALKLSGNGELRAVFALLFAALTGGETGLSLCSEDIRAFDSFAWERHAPIPPAGEKRTAHASFNDCGAKCKLDSISREGCILSLEPDKSEKDYPFTGCPRGRGYRSTFLSADRLRYPMVRAGARGEGRFRRVSWDEATTRIAGIIRSSREKYGPASRFSIPAAGVCATLRGDRFLKHILALDGGFLDFYNYYSASCALHITPYVYGTVETGNSAPDVLNTKLLILWGHNPADNLFGPRRNSAIMRAKERGARIIVIDPRRTSTAVAYADEWIPIKPSSDSALADAMCYVILKRGLEDREFIDRFCIGFDEEHMPEGAPKNMSYSAYLFGRADGVERSPLWAEGICGIPAATIERLAVEYATAKPACLLPGYAPQRTLGGEQAFYNFMALACLTGNVGKSGGSSGAQAINATHGAPYFMPAPNPYPGFIPSFLWTRAVDAPETFEKKRDGLVGIDRLETGIRTIFSIASGTMMNQHSNINDTRRILSDESKVDSIVVSDVFMTPSAMMADVLLPAPSFFEVDNIVGPWGSEEYIIFNHKAREPLFSCRFEYDWMGEVAQKLGIGGQYSLGCADADGMLRLCYDKLKTEQPELPPYEEFKEHSLYFFKDRPNVVAFADNIENGVPFQTPSGKIEIFSERLYAMDMPDSLPGRPGFTSVEEGPDDLEGMKKYPLQLLGFHSRRRCHSVHDNNPLMEELEPPAVWINPADAAPRGISDGDTVEVFNDRGISVLPAFVTDRIIPGAIAMAEGAWYTPGPDGRDMRGSINVLTMSHRATPLAKANPQHTNLADVRKAAR